MPRTSKVLYPLCPPNVQGMTEGYYDLLYQKRCSDSIKPKLHYHQNQLTVTNHSTLLTKLFQYCGGVYGLNLRKEVTVIGQLFPVFLKEMGVLKIGR